MKIYSSVQIQNELQQVQRKFKIRYQQSTSCSVPKKSKMRYSMISQTVPLRNVLSEADEYKNEKISQHSSKIKNSSLVKTQRPDRKSMKLSNNIGSLIDLINEVNPKLANHKEKDIPEKEFPKIPIEYNDEKVNGTSDSMRLKIIYRGYAPKNSYYFLKSLACKFIHKVVNELQLKPSIKRGQFQLQFSSKFESGNLSAVARKSQREFYLFMRQDTNTFGLRQWYYFTVTNNKIGRYKFRIYKFTKYYSLYKEGMKPFIRSMNEENSQWKQGGENIKYEYDTDTKSHFLEFEYQFVTQESTIQIATQPPYTYTILKDYLRLLINKYLDIKIKIAGESLAGLDIPKIQIKTKSQHHNEKKKAIIIIARTHPGETASNWTLESMIDRIYELPELRSYYDFYIIPMVNPDGVFLGNHRTGVLGQDINRNFSGNDTQFFPQVQVVQKLIQKVQKQKEIVFLLDLHGHSARRNIFAYGDEHPIGSIPFLQTHILPKLLNDQISTFKYHYCIFKGSKQKKNTARVYLGKKYKINAITFQQSYGLIDEGAIGIQHWRNFGIALANALKRYYEMFQSGQYQALQGYLKDEITEQKQKKEKKLLKKVIYQEIKTEGNTKLQQKEQTKLQIDFEKKIVSQNKKYLRPELEKSHTAIQLNQDNDNDSIATSQLSSGDQQLENTEEGMQYLKKAIVRVGCLKEISKREPYSMAQRNIEIKNNFQPRLHEQRSSMIPRILKFQLKRKQQLEKLQLKFGDFKSRKKSATTDKGDRGQKLLLPNLNKNK